MLYMHKSVNQHYLAGFYLYGSLLPILAAMIYIYNKNKVMGRRIFPPLIIFLIVSAALSWYFFGVLLSYSLAHSAWTI